MSYEHQRTELTVRLAEGNFEATLQGLETAMEMLEGGELSLDQAVDVYTAAVALSRKAESMLRDAELKITQLSENNEFSK